MSASGTPSNHHRACPRTGRMIQHSASATPTPPPARPEAGWPARLLWIWRWFWYIVLQNRVAIVVASLLWLIYRSGTQPRRLAYPCQQVAALNVGAFLAALLPALFLARRRGGEPGTLRILALKRQVVVAALLFLSVFVGIEGYQFATDVGPTYSKPVMLMANGAAATDIGIVRQLPAGAAHTPAEIEAMVRRAVELAGGLDDLMVDRTGNGQILVVIKPNISTTMWQPGDGVNTHPAVVRTLVRMAREAGADEVIIAEGVAASRDNEYLHRDVTWKGFHDAGFDSNWDRFDDETGAPLFDLNDTGGIDQFDPNKVTLVTIPNGVIRTQYWVPNILLECDVLINVPVLKNHFNGGVTLSLKNRVGCAPSDIYHAQFHPYLQQLKWSLVHSCESGFACPVSPPPTSDPGKREDEIVQRTTVDLNLVRPDDFAVIDGLMGIENGPIGQSTFASLMRVPTNLIIAGRDTLAVDTIGTLVMGYSPDHIPQLVWAHNTGALGTTDRSAISVRGDRVALVRELFQLGWDHPEQTVRVDLVPPVLTGLSVNEGDHLVGGQTLTGSGASDNVGVVKAELAIDLLGSNLVVNGDFENGATGWTTWRAPWGVNEAWDFHNTDVGPDASGNRSLKLGNSASVGSFGVYQEVAVEPGKTYRLDAYWKGQKLGDMNWFEILLLDGPWNMQQADSGTPASVYVEPNYMYAYDNNTYGLPGPIGTTFGWIWGHAQYAPPRDQVDWNNRLGRRTASGNVMTVVLKAGSTTAGIANWFDEVSLVEVLDEEILVDTVTSPGGSFDLTLHQDRLPPGTYDAELRVTVYDGALNEKSLYRNVAISSVPPEPWICAAPTPQNFNIFVGDTMPPSSVDIWNCGTDLLDYEIIVDPGCSAWLDVTSPEAVSGGEPVTHTLLLDTRDLPPGTHVGKLYVEGNAGNSPYTLTVTVNVNTVQADFDADGDVDMSDFGFIQACLSAVPGGAPPPGCEAAMLDNDQDVDQVDITYFLECLSGANVPPDPGCGP